MQVVFCKRELRMASFDTSQQTHRLVIYSLYIFSLSLILTFVQVLIA